MRPTHLVRAYFLHGLVALGLALAACSSSGDGSDQIDATTGEPDASTGGGADAAGDASGDGGPRDLPEIVRIDGPEGMFLEAQQTVVVQYSKTMDPASLKLSGSMASESAEAAWSATDHPDDTLTLTNSAGWSTGKVTLKVDAADLDGQAAPTAQTEEVILAHGMWLYVDFEHGSDEDNDGTDPGDPLATIHAALDLVDDAGAGIAVAEGAYSFDSVDDSEAQIRISDDKVTLIGGFDRDFAVHDPISHPTSIEDLSAAGGGSGNPNTPFVVSFSAANVVVDSLKVQAGTGGSSSAIVVDGTGVVLRNATLLAGLAGRFRYAVFTGGAQVEIDRCIISADSGADITIAVFVTSGDRFTLRDSQVALDGTGGSVQAAVALANLSEAHIIGNEIEAAGTVPTHAVALDEVGSAHIEGNVIAGGAGGSLHEAIRAASVSALRVENNDLHGGSGGGERRGIFLTETTAEIVGNRIFGGDSANEQSVAIYHSAAGGSSVVTENLIHGGSGPRTFAIYSEGPMVVAKNFIYAGDSESFSTGVFFNNVVGEGARAIRNNLILTGSTDAGQTGEQAQRGIYLHNAAAPVLNNTVLVDDTGDGENRGIWLETDSGGEIALINNLIVSPSRCVQADGVAPAAFLHNDLQGCPSLYVRADTDTDLGPVELDSSINDSAAITGEAATSAGNVIANPIFEDAGGEAGNPTALFRFDDSGPLFDYLVLDGDFRLADNTPAALLEGGLDLSADFGITVDIVGNPRTPPWSIGAFETDAP